jgi:hypothetical protein
VERRSISFIAERRSANLACSLLSFTNKASRPKAALAIPQTYFHSLFGNETFVRQD